MRKFSWIFLKTVSYKISKTFRWPMINSEMFLDNSLECFQTKSRKCFRTNFLNFLGETFCIKNHIRFFCNFRGKCLGNLWFGWENYNFFISDLLHLLNSGLLPTEGRKTYDSVYENINPMKVAGSESMCRKRP